MYIYKILAIEHTRKLASLAIILYINTYLIILLQARNQYDQKCRDADKAEEVYNKLQSVPTTKPQDLLKVHILTSAHVACIIHSGGGGGRCVWVVGGEG